MMCRLLAPLDEARTLHLVCVHAFAEQFSAFIDSFMLLRHLWYAYCGHISFRSGYAACLPSQLGCGALIGLAGTSGSPTPPTKAGGFAPHCSSSSRSANPGILNLLCNTSHPFSTLPPHLPLRMVACVLVHMCFCVQAAQAAPPQQGMAASPASAAAAAGRCTRALTRPSSHWSLAAATGACWGASTSGLGAGEQM
jgi:hypothetical protein